jgi:hypothetical protein
MNTTKLSEQLQSLLTEFEQDSGKTIPSVTPLLTLYRDYCHWCELHAVKTDDVKAFAIKLTSRHGLTPCRLPDGSIGVLDINLKAAMAAGVLQ